MSLRPTVKTKESVRDSARPLGSLDADGTASLCHDAPNVLNGEAISNISNGRAGSGSSSTDASVHEELEGLIPASADESPREGFGTSEKKKPRGKLTGNRANLQKVGPTGQYQLNADDVELRALLKAGLERSRAGELRAKRSQFGTTVLKKQFTAFDRANPDGDLPSFHGFFSLFWICVVFMLLRVSANNWRATGSIFGNNEIVRLMMSRDLVLLGLVDCVMMGSTVVALFIQVLVFRGWISWSRTGWIIQTIWQTIFLAGFIGFGKLRGWPWTHSVFITLHTLTMLMKQHSYAFYNGYLSEVYNRRHILRHKLFQLDDPEVLSPSSPGASAHATSYFDAADLTQLRRRRSTHQADAKIIPMDGDISAVAAAIESDATLSVAQLRSLKKLVQWEIDECSKELRGTCKETNNYYPSNLNITDAISYLPLPTVIYELEYPRQDKINWAYVAEKGAATFGVLGVMIVVSEHYIYPVVANVLQMKEAELPLSARLAEFPWAFSDLLFPFMLEYLLSWYVIWECVLNVLAELTRFADRGFYADWWNAAGWDRFARDWNRPVHNFLLRFAYQSSITTYKLSRSTATLITFLLSACVHELVMAVIFNKVRGYLLLLQMTQLPLVMISRTRFLRGRDVIGNLIFWLGIFVGPSLLCTLYLFL